MKFEKVHAYLNNFFWLFSTYLLAPYFYFRIFLLAHRSSAKREGGERKNTPLKILVIQTAKIGDMVCTTPVFREIKRKFPSCHLTVLIIAQTKDVLKNNPRLDEVILITDYPGIIGKIRLIIKLRKEKYDWAFSLLPGSFNNIIAFWSLIPNRVTTTHKGAGKIIELLAIFNNYRLEYKNYTWLIGHYLNLLKFLGIENASEEKEIFIKPAEEGKALEFLREKGLSNDDLAIGISVTVGSKIKQWDLSKWACLSDLLIEKKGAKIIFTGSADDRPTVEKVQKMMQNKSITAAGFFQLYELPALLKNLKLFISVDSGPLYMANALGTPVVDIGGTGDIREQAPTGNKCQIVLKNTDHHFYFFLDFISRSIREKYARHLQEITPEDVFEAATKLIETK